MLELIMVKCGYITLNPLKIMNKKRKLLMNGFQDLNNELVFKLIIYNKL